MGFTQGTSRGSAVLGCCRSFRVGLFSHVQLRSAICGYAFLVVIFFASVGGSPRTCFRLKVLVFVAAFILSLCVGCSAVGVVCAVIKTLGAACWASRFYRSFSRSASEVLLGEVPVSFEGTVGSVRRSPVRSTKLRLHRREGVGVGSATSRLLRRPCSVRCFIGDCAVVVRPSSPLRYFASVFVLVPYTGSLLRCGDGAEVRLPLMCRSVVKAAIGGSVPSATISLGLSRPIRSPTFRVAQSGIPAATQLATLVCEATRATREDASPASHARELAGVPRAVVGKAS